MRTIRRGLCALLVVASAIASTGCRDTTAAPIQPPADRAVLRQAMVDMVRAGAVGVQLRVHDDSGDWTASAGVSELGKPEPPSTDGRFRIGSITKTFVSTVILQLVAEGRLGLDDPADEHLPGYGIDRRITVRMLLQHTSGLFDYTGDHNSDGGFEAGIPLQGAEYVDAKMRGYTLGELARLALSKPARFAPGERWQYSNTNYVLAGLLIEKLTGTPYATQIRTRLLIPLGMSDTSLPGAEPTVAGPHAHGYLEYQRDGRTELADITELNPSWAGSAGEIISTTADLDRFLAALLGGRLLTPQLLQVMGTPFPVPDRPGGFGLGLVDRRVGPDCDVYGHTGGIHGYLSQLYGSKDGARRVAMSITLNQDPDSQAGAFIPAVMSILGTLCR
ncbi:class A beta-lactamase-related serine hydrolase [Nocardia panacis]|uniref:Class A beta-lactamase-related serine hydrolase n=1 Tax=Nocardia panacis TaxID=2340916 RepID=A0A3A4KM88_9NOCA|nr:serine hydrolase domain-containing protein [Nocardia panacis]RJO70646.1 class A beta-lactamase-related serine hydrolase [Nocardia panacis]